MHPSSGQVKTEFVAFLSESDSVLSFGYCSELSLLFSLCLECLGLRDEKLLGSAEVILTVGISEEEEEVWTLVNGTSFPGPIPEAFQTRIPSFLYSMLFRDLIPSIFNSGNLNGLKASHRVKATAGTPHDDKIASFICVTLLLLLFCHSSLFHIVGQKSQGA